MQEPRPDQPAAGDPAAERKRWMGVLARCDGTALAAHLDALGPLPEFSYLRPPEPGSVMVRARAGGSGKPFHLGEMTVTRCAVRLGDGAVGHAYVQGRDTRHAALAAVADAMLQDPARRRRMLDEVIEPLHRAWRQAREIRSRKAAATRVDFFTLVRGENPA